MLNFNKINICGIGPGNPDYILPMVYNILNNSDIVIGGERNLNVFDLKGKQTLVLRNNLDVVFELLKNRGTQKVSLVVSGDTGFYSMLATLKRHFLIEELNVVPGISSFQYMFARLGLTYENACLTSMHGKTLDIVEKVKNNAIVFCLTDEHHSWKHIANQLVNNQLGNCVMHIGNNLSYDIEQIVSETADNLINSEYDFKFCSIIIENGQ